MRDGFFKVACASPRLRVADPAYNASEIIRLIGKAADKEVGLLVLPELALTGKTC
jgi:NAD+ synthase (glutamine-hydrolysing)